MRAAGQGALCYTATRTAKGDSRRARLRARKPLTCREVPHTRTVCAILKESVEWVCKPCAGVPHAWQGWRFALPLHPSRPSVDTWEPSEGSASRHRQGFTRGPTKRAFVPLGTLTKALRPWNQTRGYRAPSTTRRDFRVPAPTTRAFALWTTSRRPSSPCTLTRGMRPLDHAQDTLFLHLSRVSPRYRQWSGH